MSMHGARRSHRSLVALLGVLAVLAAGCAGGIGTFEAPVAAVVGGTRIPESLVNSTLRIVTSPSQVLTLSQGPFVPRADTQRSVLTTLVQEELIAGQAKALGVSVTPTAVSDAIARISQSFPSSAAFLSALTSSGVSLDELTAYQRLTLIAQGVDTKVTNGINAAQADIDAAYQANQSTYAAEYDPAEILICGHPDTATGTCVTTTADLALAQSVDSQAQAGADFAQLARRYSDDTSTKAAGGDVGWVSPGDVPAEFEQAALALKPGQVAAQPLSTPAGYYIIKLLGLGQTEAEATPAINQQLEQTAREDAFTLFLQRVATKTRIVVNPSYGDFDPTSLGVVAPPGAEPSPSPSPAIPGLGG